MCFGASVLLRKASALKRIDVRYGPQNAFIYTICKNNKKQISDGCLWAIFLLLSFQFGSYG